MNEPIYVFRPKPELIWFIVVAVLTVVMQALVEFDPATITDWQAWAVGIGAAAVRAAAGALLTYLAKSGMAYNGGHDDPA